MRRKNLIAIALTAACTIPGDQALADTKAGVDAWTAGDHAGAVRFWEAEAARGDADALFNLGQAYKLGKGVKQDLARAELLFGQAAAQGHPQASDNYGLLLFQRGERGRALPYVRAAADRGDPRAQYLLGIAHFNGDLMPKDWVRAYALISLAQQQGLAQAAPALVQMDRYVPMEQRQQAVALAAELASQADATRARELAAADLGSQVPTGTEVPDTSPSVAPRGSIIAGAGDAVGSARRLAGDDSPATAGADFARPDVATQPPAARPAAAVPRLAAAASRTAPAPRGAWRVQLGAFGVAANADALWNRLRNRPELAGRPRLNVRTGAVIKLQAGGFADQTAAKAACARLQAAGFTCIPVKG